MRSSSFVSAILIILLLAPAFVSARSIGHAHANPKAVIERSKGGRIEVKALMPNTEREITRVTRQRGPDTLQIAGSSLPDCSHACGSCTPCRLVMVSFVCSSLEEAETCPIAYKCMCNNMSFPVP